MSSQIIEPELSPTALDIHRALSSLQEELEAIDDYHQRAEASENESLKAVLIHNRDDEMEHAAMLMEWLRRAMPPLEVQMRKFLFKHEPPIDPDRGSDFATNGGIGLGLGNLK